MSDVYLLLTPILILLIVALLGFVGCASLFGLDEVPDVLTPRNLQLTPDNMRVDLTWEHPSNGMPSGYRISRGTQPGSRPYSLDVGLVTSYSDTDGIENGMTYYYAVSSIKDGQVRGTSDEKMVVAGYTGLTALVTGIMPGTLRSDFTGFVGMKLRVAGAPLIVKTLGRFKIAGNTRTHLVKLVDAASSMDVPGGSITIDMSSTATAMAFVYADLPAPVTLAADTEYFLVSQEETNTDDWYDSSNTRITTTNVVTGILAVNGNLSGGYVVGMQSGLVYGPLDLQY